MDIIRQSACLVINSIRVNSYVVLFSCGRLDQVGSGFIGDPNLKTFIGKLVPNACSWLDSQCLNLSFL